METYIGSVEANASNGVSSSKQIRIRHNGMLVIYAKSDMLIRQYVTGSASISHDDTILWQNTKNSTGWYTINLFEGWKCFSINENDILLRQQMYRLMKAELALLLLLFLTI